MPQMNFTEQLIHLGFKEIFASRMDSSFIFNLNNGWLGLTVYHPDMIFSRDNISVVMSLQGLLCDYDKILGNYELEALSKDKAIKYISVKDGDNLLYETFGGEITDINNFI